MVNAPVLHSDAEQVKNEIIQLIITTVQEAIDKINTDCNEVEVRFPAEVAQNISRVLDEIFSKVAITVIDRGDGWHSFALSEDGEICKLSRGSNISTFLPNLKTPDEDKHFRVFHRSGVDNSFESIVNEDLADRAFAAIAAELITASEKDDVVTVELKDPVLISDLAKTRRATFMAIAKRLINASSWLWQTLPGNSQKKVHSVALSENGASFVLSRAENKSLSSLGATFQRCRVFHDAK